MFCAAYIASLAAMIMSTHKGKLVVPFKSFQEMESQTSVPYGFMAESKVLKELSESTDSMFRRMVSYAGTYGSTSIRTLDDAVEKVRVDNYGVVIDSLSGKYLVRNNCDLMLVGELIQPETIAFACKPNSGVCNMLNAGLIELLEGGMLHRTTLNWWDNRGSCPVTHLGNYVSAHETHSLTHEPLSVSDVSWIWLMILIGYVLGIILLVVELLVQYCRRSVGTKQDDYLHASFTGFNVHFNTFTYVQCWKLIKILAGADYRFL